MEIHQSNPRRQLFQEGAFGSRQNEVHPNPPLGDALQQVENHPLGAAAVQ
jgi:hypothetical protein